MQKYSIILILLFLPLIFIGQDVDVFEKNIDYTCYNKPLSDVLVDLSTRTKVNIAFDPTIIPADKLISLNIKDESLADVLEVILDDTNIEYEMLGGQIILTSNQSLTAKGKFIISGFLEDVTSSERLIYATIYNYADRIGTTTNEYGFFTIESSDSIAKIGFSYLGYEPIVLDLDSNEKGHIIALNPNIRLNEILIEDYRLPSADPIEDMNTFPLATLKTMTSLAGEPDVIRLAGMQAGVSSGADGVGGLNVRGGSADQNLILLDGVPVYNTGHTLGMFSVFNSSMIKSSTLIKDAFPAKYGGRLSSVLDIRTKEGNLKKLSGHFSIGTMAASGTIEGPLKTDKVGFIVSFRQSFVNSWLKTFSSGFKEAGGNAGEIGYNFFDVNAKIHAKVGKKGTFALSYYEGRDLFYDETLTETPKDSLDFEGYFKTEWTWGNRILSARYSTQASEKLYFSSTLYYSRFKFDAFKNDQETVLEDRVPINLFYQGSLFETGITDIGARLDFDYSFNNRHNLKFGLDGVQHRFSPGLILANQTDSLITFGEVLTKQDLKETIDFVAETGIEGNLYIEDHIRASDFLEIIAGVRATLIRSRNNNYYSLLPTVTINTKVTPNALVKATYSRTTQYLHLLSTSGLGLPTDIWLPTTDVLQPQRGEQYTLGILVRDRQVGHIEVSAFYKNLTRVLALREGPIFDINQSTDWESDIPVGTGLSRGIEFTAVKTIGRLKGMVSYTWSQATRQFEEVNNGQTFPFRYDRRHMFNSSWSYRVNKNIELSANGIYQKGNWATIPSQFISLGEESNQVLPL